MSEIRSYKDLLIWQKGIELTEKVYLLVKSFPSEEIYSLTSQIKRSVISIPSNISEGYGRSSTKNYIQFLRISRGSLYELETQLIISGNLNYIQKETQIKMIEELNTISRMIQGLIKSIT